MDDSILTQCNETELLSIAHSQGLGRLKRGLPRELLIQIVRGEADPEPEHLSTTQESRKVLQAFLAKHWEQVRSQLPGCDGCCTTFPCSEARHALCFGGNKDTIVTS